MTLGKNPLRENPFRLAAARQSTFPKGTASAVAAKFPAQPKGVPLGELSSVARLRGLSLNPTRENAMPERPQTLRHCSIKNHFSAIHAQSKAERISNRIYQLIYAAIPMVPSSGSSPS